jgi:hypothetical protein
VLRRRQFSVAAVGIAALGGLAFAAAPAQGGNVPSGPVFKPAVRLLTPGLPYGLVQAEPSIKTDATGRIYVVAPASNVIGCEFWTVSPDLSQQRFVTPPDHGVGGGDCDLAVSHSTPAGQSAQTVSYSSLYLANLISTKSNYAGATFVDPQNFVDSEMPMDDRQWLAAGEGNEVYLSYHIVASNNIQIAKSTDGGMTYHVTGLAPGYGQAIDADHIGQALMNNELGPIVVDTHSSLSPKPVYTIFTAPDTLIENQGSGDGSTKTLNHDVFLASSYDGGVTWRDTLIYRGPIERTYDHIFPALDVDDGGNLWAAWISDEEHVYVSRASASPLAAPPTAWSEPLRVDNTGSATNVFPWIVAGGNGFADVVWYGGTSADPLRNNDVNNTWNVHFTQLRYQKVRGVYGVQIAGAAVASPRPNHIGAICTTGVTCDSTTNARGLLDFFQVALMPDGRAVIAYADDTDISLGGAQVYVAQQCAGISAKTGQQLTPTC